MPQGEHMGLLAFISKPGPALKNDAREQIYSFFKCWRASFPMHKCNKYRRISFLTLLKEMFLRSEQRGSVTANDDNLSHHSFQSSHPGFLIE